MTAIAEAIFQIPPFPGARPEKIVTHKAGASPKGTPTVTAAMLIAFMRQHQVGGAFWQDDDIWSTDGGPVSGAGDDPKLLLAALAGHTIQPVSAGLFSDLALDPTGSPAFSTRLETLVTDHLLDGLAYADPFTGEPISPLALVEILASWCRLIAANKPIVAAFGFAHWKRDTVDPLLWGGHPVAFLPARSSALAALPAGASIAVWKARVPAAFLAEVEAGPWRLLEVEDGFIRSAGLGADCVPPLSIVVDDLGVHYDRSRPNRLEEMLAREAISPADLERAHRLQDWIVSSGITKYGISSGRTLAREGGHRRHLLVVGQVEDDRSVQYGSADVRSNLELLTRVRATNPEAWIIYRPHPDVEAGHRRGAIPDQVCREIANSIKASEPISALIAIADEVHVMTSLAGFEALMQGKRVTTHGTPFFAGWGLTHDLANIPARRGRTLSLDELVAAVLLRYPRYLDPVTNLPCTAEVLIMRLLSGVQRQNAALVPLRRVIGWVRRSIAQLVGS